MDKATILNNIFDSDPLGILEIKAKNPILTADDRLIATFEEINEFYEKYDSEPTKSNDMHERKLSSRLEGLKNNPDKIQALKQYDRFNLLMDK